MIQDFKCLNALLVLMLSGQQRSHKIWLEISKCHQCIKILLLLFKSLTIEILTDTTKKLSYPSRCLCHVNNMPSATQRHVGAVAWLYQLLYGKKSNIQRDVCEMLPVRAVPVTLNILLSSFFILQWVFLVLTSIHVLQH